ncbi:DUF2325 domain-containing protein [Chloroflexus aggregans]|uniref:DUF2325 domain-containing protein n=1 Tax=Chloroflexus aggregans (strain MD-66 / DSM 9485) TaxID=326427 RepID=B8GBL1_CHLAD|nr:DUF2325 domain-containing protein [Chloroflexus aggregans]ACL22958.1 hypothetical protein Cagg_0005 [Chloroflexus aggregans DSM 9485]
MQMDNNSQLIAAITAIVTALQNQAQVDASLRHHLRVLGEALLAMADDASATAVSEPVQLEYDEPSASATVAGEEAVATAPELPQATLPRATEADLLRLVDHFSGNKAHVPPPAPVAKSAPTDANEVELLTNLSTCLFNKAAYIRQVLDEPESALDKTEPCTAWIVNQLKQTLTKRRDDWAVLAGSCEVAAIVVDALSEIVDNPSFKQELKEGLALAAEAQSALFVAVQRLRKKPDPTQLQLFEWLQRRTKQDGIYLERYMRRADQADPTQWQTRRARVEEWRAALDQAIYRRRRQRKLLNKLRYQLDQVQRGDDEQWPKALQTVITLVDLGIPPSDRTLRRLLLPFRERLHTVSEEARQLAWVVRELDRAAPALPDDEEGAVIEEVRDNPLVKQVAELLQNKSVVLIGGDERPQIKQMIEEEFKLRELIWCDTRPHHSYVFTEPSIARPEVAVVLLAIRWASHGLGSVKDFCDRYNKPLVRLPAGYSVSQIAYQIWEQASSRLRDGLSADR